jgi:hypothetical protein
MNGAGFTTLERWLGEFDVLFLRRNNADLLVLVPWRHLGAHSGTGAAMICTLPTGEEKQRRAAALPSNSAAIQSEKSAAHDTTAMRDFLVAALRCARCRALLLANEIDAVGFAVSRELVTLGAAYNG